MAARFTCADERKSRCHTDQKKGKLSPLTKGGGGIWSPVRPGTAGVKPSATMSRRPPSHRLRRGLGGTSPPGCEMVNRKGLPLRRYRSTHRSRWARGAFSGRAGTETCPYDDIVLTPEVGGLGGPFQGGQPQGIAPTTISFYPPKSGGQGGLPGKGNHKELPYDDIVHLSPFRVIRTWCPGRWGEPHPTTHRNQFPSATPMKVATA